MIVSEARIAANRRNALKSGPRTPEGKERSRANALKHGLCSTVVVAEDVDLVRTRALEWFHALRPQNEYHTALVDEVALVSVRIDRCERMERRIRDKVALRAELTWDDDRRLEASILGGMLARRPEETVETLRRTPQGCEWLMTRWALLAHAADSNEGRWTDDQTRLAFDLLATPREFRDGRKPGASIDFRGNVLDPGDDPAAVARREVDALQARRDLVGDLDEVERALTESDMTNDADPELRRLRRYEAALHRRLRWCLSQINTPSPHKHTAPGLNPRWADEPAESIKPEPTTEAEKAAAVHPPDDPHPPFDLEPGEFTGLGEDVDIPSILNTRREKRQAKAEARRDGRRRKLERLRA